MDIVLNLAPPDCNYTPIRDPFKREELIPKRDTSEREELTTPAYYFRFRIYNHGESLAKDVEVVLEELWVKREDTGYFMKNETFPPMNLVWTHMRSMVSSDSAVVIRQNIQPYGAFKFCDLCYIVKGRPWLFFDSFLESFAPPNFVIDGTYKIKVVASSSNSKPTHRWFQIKWTGKWTVGEEEMFTEKHIIIEPATSER